MFKTKMWHTLIVYYTIASVHAFDLLFQVDNIMIYKQARFQEFQFSTKVLNTFNFDEINKTETYAKEMKEKLKNVKFNTEFNLVADLLYHLARIKELSANLPIEPRPDYYIPSCTIVYASFISSDWGRYDKNFQDERKVLADKVINTSMSDKDQQTLRRHLASLIQAASRLKSDIIQSNRINGELISGKIPYELQSMMFKHECWEGTQSKFEVDQADCYYNIGAGEHNNLNCNIMIRLDENPTDYLRYISIPFRNISLDVKELYALPESPHQLYTIDCKNDIINDRICDINEYNKECTDGIRAQNIYDIEFNCVFVEEKQSLPFYFHESLILFDKNCKVENFEDTEIVTQNLTDRNYPLLIKGGIQVNVTCINGKYIYQMTNKDIEITDFSLTEDQQRRLSDGINETIAYYSGVTIIFIFSTIGTSILVFIIYRLKNQNKSNVEHKHRRYSRRRKVNKTDRPLPELPALQL